jgi:hypothetical protein
MEDLKAASQLRREKEPSKERQARNGCYPLNSNTSRKELA